MRWKGVDDAVTGLVLIVGAVLVFGLSAYRENVRLSRKDLEFACGPSQPGSVDDQVEPMHYAFRGLNYYNKGRYFRVVARSVSEVPVKDCAGVLTAIRRDGKDLFPANNQRLTWQPGTLTQGQQPITIYREKPGYLDVLRLSQDNNQIIFGTHNHEWSYQPPDEIFKSTGTYHIEVVVTGGEKSYRLSLEFLWTGNWATSELKPPSDNSSLPSRRFPQ